MPYTVEPLRYAEFIISIVEVKQSRSFLAWRRNARMNIRQQIMRGSWVPHTNLRFFMFEDEGMYHICCYSGDLSTFNISRLRSALRPRPLRPLRWGQEYINTILTSNVDWVVDFSSETP